jgi:hypothetical protein
MEFLISIVICIVALLALNGCKSASTTISDDEPEWTFQTPGQLHDRLNNAGQIIDFKLRDQAMARVAIDAAGSDAPGIALEAVGNITEFQTRDQAATDCAQVLDGRGDRPSADKMAGQVTDFTARDRIRSWLAARPPRDRAAWSMPPATQSTN